MVAKQLGRPATIEFIVAISCPCGWPAVIRNAPLSSEGNPNPNLFYLTCPFLRKNIARLENSGFISRLETIVAEQPELMAEIRGAQREHRQEWSQTVAATGETGKQIADVPPPNIAAARDDMKVKCLHAHFAWFLIHPEYQPGILIQQELGQDWCADKSCLRMVEE